LIFAGEALALSTLRTLARDLNILTSPLI